MKITILFATETGNAETLADDLHDELAGDHEVRTASLADFGKAASGADLSLLVISTYGDGELPGMAKNFFAALEAGDVTVRGERYAVFGLGDRNYGATFGQASRLAEENLAKQGALIVAERDVHDASGPEFMDDQAKRWCAGVLQKLVS
jgi:MioC protein